ncbi:replication-relaxation family protein [Bacillus cytotoxicus]|uniref:Replication-relaxation family protein n=1 Tax=Bacillus cytotoxicus TaxID=580165 RepID=A0ACC6A6G4_9BACI|nr:replication-relaxation family protein [Bacillus cytotoxicus]
MNKRDKAIVNDLYRFRVLSRDQIIAFHFSQLKKPVSTCNLILKRLQDRGHIKAFKGFQPFVYASVDSKIKESSQKILHFLAIADTFIEMKKYDEPTHVLIEPKFAEKGTIEPDAFCIFKRTPFFIEIQRSVYSEKVMKEKIGRYEAFYHSEVWKEFEWQKTDKKVFPIILFITDTRYNIETDVLRIVQAPNITDLVHLFESNSPQKKHTHNTVSKDQKPTIRIQLK